MMQALVRKKDKICPECGGITLVTYNELINQNNFETMCFICDTGQS